MASKIMLTESNLKAKKEELEKLNSELKSKIKDMNETEKTVKSMWKGDAADAFDAGYQKDITSYEKFIDLVRKYTQALDDIMKAYEKSEAANIQIAKKRSYK